MGLTRAALARPVFILMLMLAAFLLGTIAYRSMRQELNPDVSFPVVSISTSENIRFVSMRTEATWAMWIECSSLPTHCGV